MIILSAETMIIAGVRMSILWRIWRRDGMNVEVISRRPRKIDLMNGIGHI